MKKFLFLYRSPESRDRKQPSPQEMEQMFAAWTAWKEKFKANILDLGDGLKPEGRLLTTTGVTDGPFVEAKEIVGGFSIVSAESYDHAVTVAKDCPILLIPGSRVEIREMMGF
jgi:hypothetical protein